MQKNIWYNVRVPKTLEKKNVNFSLKVPESLLEALGAIGEHEDRPLGYVGRELMIRGLALYRVDGRLRDEPVAKPERHLAPVVATITPPRPAELSRSEIQRTISNTEIERGVTPRKTQRVGVLKGKAK